MLKYTGSVDVLLVGDKRYAQPALYAKNPAAYNGSFDKPIPGLSKETALNLIEHSSLHSFEDVASGEDMLDMATAPAQTPAEVAVASDAPKGSK